MARKPLLFVICSDQPRNGKTLLARVLTDFLLLEGHDPFLIDLSHPEGTLRGYFPGRTALVDFAHVSGQMKAFDTIMAAPNRDYVIDVAAPHLPIFLEAATDLGFIPEIRRLGLDSVVFYIIDKDEESLRAAAQAEALLLPDLFIPVRSDFVGSALPPGFGGLTITVPALEPEILDIVSSRRFSFRTFLLGEEAAVPLRLRPELKTFLGAIIDRFRDIDPALSLLKLHG